MFDVGHGDCVLIIDDRCYGLLVDCGSRNPQNHSQLIGNIENSFSQNIESITYMHNSNFLGLYFMRAQEANSEGFLFSSCVC